VDLVYRERAVVDAHLVDQSPEISLVKELLPPIRNTALLVALRPVNARLSTSTPLT
jgi:hypothetical protein